MDDSWFKMEQIIDQNKKASNSVCNEVEIVSERDGEPTNLLRIMEIIDESLGHARVIRFFSISANV